MIDLLIELANIVAGLVLSLDNSWMRLKFLSCGHLKRPKKRWHSETEIVDWLSKSWLRDFCGRVREVVVGGKFVFACVTDPDSARSIPSDYNVFDCLAFTATCTQRVINDHGRNVCLHAGKNPRCDSLLVNWLIHTSNCINHSHRLRLMYPQPFSRTSHSYC